MSLCSGGARECTWPLIFSKKNYVFSLKKNKIVLLGCGRWSEEECNTAKMESQDTDIWDYGIGGKSLSYIFDSLNYLTHSHAFYFWKWAPTITNKL